MDGQVRRHRERGTTLIELLVVVTILAVLAVAVSLRPIQAAAGATQDAARFERQITALQNLALQGRTTFGLRISPRQMQVLHLERGKWQDRGPPARWSGRAVFSGRGGIGQTPDILLLPDGRYTPFDIRFGPVLCRGDGWGALKCEG